MVVTERKRCHDTCGCLPVYTWAALQVTQVCNSLIIHFDNECGVTSLAWVVSEGGECGNERGRKVEVRER